MISTIGSSNCTSGIPFVLLQTNTKIILLDCENERDMVSNNNSKINFVGCSNHYRIEIRFGAYFFIYKRHGSFQYFEYFALSEFGDSTIKVCFIRDVITGVENASNLLWVLNIFSPGING